MLLDGTRVEGSTFWKDRPVVLRSRLWARADRSQPDRSARWMDDDGDVATYPSASIPARPIRPRYPVSTPPAVVLIAPGGKLLRGWPGGVDTDTLKDELARLVRR